MLSERNNARDICKTQLHSGDSTRIIDLISDYKNSVLITGADKIEDYSVLVASSALSPSKQPREFF